MNGIAPRLSLRITGPTAVLAALSMFFTFAPPARAQGKAGDGPTPKTADGHPDFTGRYVFAGGATTVEKPSFKPETKSKYEITPPYGTCSPIGTPTAITVQTTQRGPIELISKPDVMWILTILPQSVRRVVMNGQHSKDPDTSAAGEAVAHWDGETLVVDTLGIDPRMQNVAVGGLSWFHSDQEHVVERFTRPTKGSLTYQLTVEDPVVLSKPFTSPVMHWNLATDDSVWKQGVPHPGCDY